MARLDAGTRRSVRDMGTCLTFNGTTTDVTVTSQLFYQNTGYSFSLWLRATGSNTGGRILCLGSSSSTNPIWILQNSTTSGKKANVLIRDDSTGITPLGSSGRDGSLDIMDGLWHQIAWTDNNGAAVMYIDGVADLTSFNYTRSGNHTLNRTAFGALVRITVANWFKGQIDDVRIWNNTVLTAAQIADLYYKHVNPSTPTSWYKCDEGSGTTATDSGSLATNGTITNATYSSNVFMIPRSGATGRIAVV